jgi:type II secretory pathway component PulF
MPVFEYTAHATGNEESLESGVVVAHDRLEAYDKVRRQQLNPIALKKLEGIQAFFGRRTADIR